MQIETCQFFEVFSSKLKDLEDDNKSTVSSVFDIDAAASVMRKELYRIEQEKADQEKHFMNQSITKMNGH